MFKHRCGMPARRARCLLLAALGAALLVVSQLAGGLSTGFAITALAASAPAAHPNRVSANASSSSSVSHLLKPPPAPTGSGPRIPAVPMRLLEGSLDPASGAHLTYSGGVLGGDGARRGGDVPTSSTRWPRRSCSDCVASFYWGKTQAP